MTCGNCGSPERKLWPPVPAADIPKFARVVPGNYILLDKCPICNELWCSSPYEPFSAFTYYVKWDLTEADWKYLHYLDEGETLRTWHICKIKELWKNLNQAGLEAVELHRKRTYYSHNPVDFKDVPTILDLSKLIQKG